MTDNNTNLINRNMLGLTTPIVLVGLMGAGKTTIGRRLANELGLDFVDSDNEIVEAAECSIADIFELYGEPIFRDLEKRVILRLLDKEPIILATGGGAFMNAEVRQAIKSKAISIWLKADIEVLLERVGRRNNRPLLEQGDKREILSKLLEERSPIYAEADFAVNSGSGGHDAIVGEILRHLKSRTKL